MAQVDSLMSVAPKDRSCCMTQLDSLASVAPKDRSKTDDFAENDLISSSIHSVAIIGEEFEEHSCLTGVG